MNPFRIILLVLLTLSLLMLFYVVAIYVPQHKEEYQQYQSMNYMTQIQGKHAEHEKRMSRIAPQPAKTPKSELTAAQQEAAASAAKQKRMLLEAEERRVIAEARTQERQQQGQPAGINMSDAGLGSSAAIAAHDAKDAELDQLATVFSYDANWGILTIVAVKGKNITSQQYTGKRIMIKRNHGLVCEAVIESKDEKTGRVVAHVETNTLNPVAKVVPQAGDKVYLSNLASAHEIRNTGGSALPPVNPVLPSAYPPNTSNGGSVTPEEKKLEEMEMPLVPTSV